MGMEYTRFPISFGDKLFTACTIILSTGIVILGRSSIIDEMNSDNRILQIAWCIVYGISFLRLVFSAERRPIFLSGNAFVWPLMILALFSVSWSFFPLLTLQRCIALLGTYIFALYLTKFYEWWELLTILTVSFGFLEVLSLLYVIFLPSYGLDPVFVGAWRGVFFQKNGLGGTMVLAAFFWIFKIKMCPSFIAKGFLVLSVLLVIFSTSKTSLVMLLIVGLAALLPIKKLLELNYRNLSIAVFLVLLLGLSVSFLLTNYTLVLDLFDRDITLTGRTILWNYTWDMIQLCPWTGYGYGAFWLGWNGPSSYIWRYAGWETPHSHNGLLDVCCQVGVFGAVLVSLSWFVNLVKSIQILQYREEFGHAALALLSYFIIYNIDESKLLIRNSFPWIFYVYISLNLNIFTRLMAGDSSMDRGNVYGQEYEKDVG